MEMRRVLVRLLGLRSSSTCNRHFEVTVVAIDDAIYIDLYLRKYIEENQWERGIENHEQQREAG